MGRTVRVWIRWALAGLALGLGTATAQGAEVQRATLENGLQVVVVRDALAPVVTTEINYLVGSRETPEGFPGTAHAVEHMMFRGSPGLSASQLSYLIAGMGGQFNANTQPTVTQYFLTVPAEDLEAALHVEAIRMAGLSATAEAWEQERGAIDQEVAQDLSNPMYVFYSRLLAAVFAGTPYAHDALGTRESFQRTTAEMLRTFHRQWYAPNNAILVVTGDVDPGAVVAAVKRLFGPIPSREVPSRPVVEPPPPKAAELRVETDLPYGMVVVAYRQPGYQSPDYAAAQVLGDVLDSERGALYGLVPEGKALFAGFGGTTLPEVGLGYATAGFPPGGDGDALVAAVKAVVGEYAEKGVPAELVEAAVRQEVARAEFRKNSIPGLADLWSRTLAVEGRRSPEEDVEAIRRVTVADVNRVAKKYLHNDTAVVGILPPRTSGPPAGSAGAMARQGQESFAPSQAAAVELPPWARDVVEPPDQPASGLAPVDVTLPNGLRLIVQPEAISPTVSLYGEVRHRAELEEPKGKEGVGEVLDGLFSYGTADLGRLAFRRAVDEIGADLSAGASFSLQVLDEHFERGVELLAGNLLHPALPEEGFRVVRDQTAGAVAGRLRSPDYLHRRALRAALYPDGDPTLRQATPETVSTLKRADVVAYHRKIFRPDLTTVVVVGRVSPKRAREVVEKYFGGWRAEGDPPATDLPPVPPNGPSAAVVPDRSRVQDQVTLAQTLGVERTSRDYYALELGNHVLSGAFYATRLYRDLRKEAGLVYTVESFLDAGRTRAVFGVFYACDPPQVSRARALVVRDLNQMQTEPVTAVELRQARTLLVRQVPLSEASTSGIGRGLLSRSMDRLPLDEPTRAARHYLELTAEDVQAAFAKWLRPKDLVQVTLGPEPR